MKNKYIKFSILCILCIQFVNAELFQFDNSKDYDSLTKTITIKNTFGIGRTIADIKLNTPLINKVPFGSIQKVAEFQIISYEDYTNAIENMKFYDLNNRNTEISKTFEYKVKGIEEIEVNDYKDVCLTLNKNGTGEKCKNEVVGTHKETREVWTTLSKMDFLKDEIKTIGVFTYVNKGDSIEWVINAYGKDLTEWAYWVADLDVGLISYFSMDESVGTTLINNITSAINGTFVNMTASHWTTGKLGNGLSFNSTIDEGVNLTGLTSTTGSYTFNYWIKNKGNAGADANVLDIQTGRFIQDIDTNEFEATITTQNKYGVLANEYQMLTLVIDGVNNVARVYFNGTTNGTNITYTIDKNLGGEIALGNRYNIIGETGANFDIDELGIWNRTLSEAEITNLYNGGLGVAYGNYAPTINLTLNSPINYYNSTNADITFNITATDIQKVVNVTLYIDGVLNETDTSEINGTYLFNKTLSEGSHNWSILAFNNNSKSRQSETRFLNVDLNFPVVNIIFPVNNSINYTNLVTSNILNASIVWTASDVNLDKCFLSNISTGANITGTCNDLNNTFYVPAGTYNFFTYANDTFGRYTEKLTRASFLYKIYEINQSYTTNVTEYSFEHYYANVYINSAFSVSSVLFNFNGTNYTASSSEIANYTRFAKTNFQLPVIEGNVNNTFSWFVTLNDSSVIELTTKTQQENNLSFGSCVSFPYQVLNYSLVDEKTQSSITGTIETNIQIKTKDELTIIYNWTSSTAGASASLCSNIPLTSSSYSIYGTIRYYASNENYSASIEYYNYLNYTLDNSTQYINTTLYDLNVSESTDFQLTFKDSSYRTRGNILIYVYRQYLPSGDFKIVEVPKTDSNGQTIVHLVRNDIVYNLIAVDSAGNILGNLNNVLAFCKDYTIGECVINFQGTTTETGLEDFLSDVGISYNLSYSNTTNLISLTFLSSNTTAKDVRMEVISSAIVTNRTICDTSLNAITGTLTCDVSSLVNTTASANVKIYVNGIQKIEDSLSFDSSAHNIAGLIFFGFIMLLMVGIFFIESKEGVIIGVILSFIVLVTLGIVKGSIIGVKNGIYASVLWLIVVGIILLFKLNGEKQ